MGEEGKIKKREWGKDSDKEWREGCRMGCCVWKVVFVEQKSPRP